MQRDTITWMLCISNFIQVRMWAMVSRLPQSNYNDMGKQFLLWRNVRQVKFIPHRWRTNIYWPTILSNCFKTHPQIFSLPKLNLHVCWWRQSGSEHPANVMQFTSRTQNWVSVVSIRGLLGGGRGGLFTLGGGVKYLKWEKSFDCQQILNYWSKQKEMQYMWFFKIKFLLGAVHVMCLICHEMYLCHTF